MAAPSSSDTGTSTNNRKYSHPLHASSLLNNLNEGRKNPQLCDGVLVISGEEIPVQKNILSAACPYFRALYTYQNPKPGDGSKKISETTLDTVGITATTFCQILDYIYTSVIVLNDDNIQDILQAADILLMSDLKELCCDYLESCITVANCIGIREFAEQFSCPRVLFAATSFMEEHFGEVAYTEEFLALPVEKVVSILTRNRLAVETEDAIFDAIMRWVRHDVNERQCHLKALTTECVHMNLLDERYVKEHVLPDELIKSSGLESTILRMRRGDSTQLSPRGYTNMIVFAGGEGPSERDNNTVEIKASVRCVAPHMELEAKFVHWIDLAPMLQPRIGHGLVEAGGNLYAIGGRDNTGRILNTGEFYDPGTNTWTAISPMQHARVGFGLVVVDNKIYALGGSNDMSDPLVSGEVYNIYTNKWRSLPDTNLKRAWSAYAMCNKKLYVIGGGTMGKLYEAVECFDPQSETWNSVASLKERRFDARAIGFGEDLYVFGGLRRLECPSAYHTGSGMKFCSTEVYSTEQQVWTALGRNMGMCTMTENSHIDAVVRFGEEILLMGDFDIGNNVCNCVRAYKPSAKEWRGVIQNHPPSQRGMQAALLKIPNAKIYSLLWKQSRLTRRDLESGTMAGCSNFHLGSSSPSKSK